MSAGASAAADTSFAEPEAGAVGRLAAGTADNESVSAGASVTGSRAAGLGVAAAGMSRQVESAGRSGGSLAAAGAGDESPSDSRSTALAPGVADRAALTAGLGGAVSAVACAGARAGWGAASAGAALAAVVF